MFWLQNPVLFCKQVGLRFFFSPVIYYFRSSILFFG